MSDESAPTAPTPDTETLAQQFVGGKTLKRVETMDLVRSLLALLNEARAAGAPTLEEKLAMEIPQASPPCPIAIGTTPTGAIVLGQEACRFYTPDEAVGLALGLLTRARGGQ